MAITISSVMVVLLLLGFPMMIPLIAGAFVGVILLFGNIVGFRRVHAEYNIGLLEGGFRIGCNLGARILIGGVIVIAGHSESRFDDDLNSESAQFFDGIRIHTSACFRGLFHGAEQFHKDWA